MTKQLRVNTRSEWVNGATDAMWDAVIGWPHFGEDDNVNRLEAMVAYLAGKESSTL
jgi:threonine aldolase